MILWLGGCLPPDWKLNNFVEQNMDDVQMTMRTLAPDGSKIEGVSFTGGDLMAAAGSASGNPRMKPDPDFDAARDKAYRVTAGELRQFVERFELLDAEKKDIADQQKEVMSEAKARGYDTKVLRKVIALRKRERDDIAEEEAVLALYREALGC